MEPARYWIEVAVDPNDNPDMVGIRLAASGLVSQGHWSQGSYLYALSSRIGGDPTREATETVRLMRGYGMVGELPDEVRALLATDLLPFQTLRLSIAWYPNGAKDLYLNLLKIEDTMPGEDYELVHLYLLKTAETQANLNVEMDGRQTLQWIVDHWHLGDVGCAQALARRSQSQGGGNSPSEPTTRGHHEILANTLAPRRPSRAVYSPRPTADHLPHEANSPTPTLERTTRQPAPREATAPTPALERTARQPAPNQREQIEMSAHPSSQSDVHFEVADLRDCLKSVMTEPPR